MERLKGLLREGKLKDYNLNNNNEYLQIENILYMVNDGHFKHNTIYPLKLNGRPTLLLRVELSYYVISFISGHWYQFKASKKKFKEIGVISKNDFIDILNKFKGVIKNEK